MFNLSGALPACGCDKLRIERGSDAQRGCPVKIGRRLAVSNNVMAVVPAAIGLIAGAVAVVAAWVLIGDALGLRAQAPTGSTG